MKEGKESREIILQLHAEVDAGSTNAAPAPSSETGAASASADSAPQDDAPDAKAQDAAPIVTATDMPEGGVPAGASTLGLKRTADGKVELDVFVNGGKEPQAQEDPQGGQQTGPRSQEPAARPFTETSMTQMPDLPMYTLAEFTDALRSGGVDDARVPPEFRGEYNNFKIRQAAADYTARMAQAQKDYDAQQAQAQAALSPEAQREAMQKFYAEVERNANELAMKDMGLDAQALEDLEFADDGEEKLRAYATAKEWHKQQIISNIQQQMAQEKQRQEAQRGIYKDITDFIASARAAEPNFSAIDAMMGKRYLSLPYSQAMPIQAAIAALNNGTITDAQATTLRQYYESCRREYYGRQNNVSQRPRQVANRPPAVESGAGMGSYGKTAAPDYGALRSASNAQAKTEWLKNYFFGNNRS